MTRRDWLTLSAALVLTPVLVTWPVLPGLTTALPAAPDQEAATHIWGLWAALESGHPLIGQTDLMAFPTGTPMVLVDPGNLPWFALGSILGPIAGYNSVVLAGALLMGVAGALLAREAGGSPALGAVLAAATPTVLGHAAEGMTEGAGVGWVGIHLAMLLAYRREGHPWQGALAVGSAAACWYTGPYNGLWAALLGVGLGLGSLRAVRQGRWRPFARLAAVGAASAMVVAPLARAVLTVRPPSLPGSAERSGLPRVQDWPDRFRGGLEAGADLLDPLLPVLLTGGEAPVPHTAYVGLALVVASAVAVARAPRQWPWLAGAAAFSLLSLGPWLYLGGEALRFGDKVVPGPAAGLMLAIPGLARVTRWYRAGAVAGLLLAALGSTAPRGRMSRIALGLTVLVDALLLSPLQWPLLQTPLPAARMVSALPQPGALVELPPATTGEPPPGRWRDLGMALQVFHGRPVGGGAMGVTPSDAARGAQSRLEALMRGAGLDARGMRRTREAGFRYLAVYPAHRPLPAEARRRLEVCLGPPLSESEDLWLFDLEGGASGCAPTSGGTERR